MKAPGQDAAEAIGIGTVDDHATLRQPCLQRLVQRPVIGTLGGNGAAGLGISVGAGRRRVPPLVDLTGATKVPGIFAAGAVFGAATDAEVARQGVIANRGLPGQPAKDCIVPPQLRDLPAYPKRLDLLAVAQLLEGPPGTAGSAMAPAQAGLCSARLTSVVVPAPPVEFAALAALTPGVLPPRGGQSDAERLRRATASSSAAAGCC